MMHETHTNPFLFDQQYYYLDVIDSDLILMFADEIVINPNKNYITASNEDILHIESYCQPFDTELHLLSLIEEALK